MMYPPLAKVRYEELGKRLPQIKRVLAAVAGPELGHRSAADVRPGGGVPARQAGVHAGPHPDRPGALHRHGDRVERSWPRATPSTAPGLAALQLDLPGAVLPALRLLLRHPAAGLARPPGRRREHHRSARSRRASAIYLGVPFAGGLPDPRALVGSEGATGTRTRFVPRIGPYHPRRPALHHRGHVLARRARPSCSCRSTCCASPSPLLIYFRA